MISGAVSGLAGGGVRSLITGSALATISLRSCPM